MTKSRFLCKLLSSKKACTVAKKGPKQTYFGSTSKTCHECGMTFTMSEADIKLHRKHHYEAMHGIVFPLKGNFYKIEYQDSKSMVILICEESPAVNHKLQEILKIVDESLGSSLDSSTAYKVKIYILQLEVFISLWIESFRRFIN